MLQTIQVSEYESLLPSVVEVYRLEADNFQAGQLPYFVNEWRALGCYMCSVDLKSAYYSVAIAPSDQKYLKFSWCGKLYQFTCFPNGLAFCPRKFTKLLEPVYSTLRNLGHLSVAYIDDSYLQADTYELCVQNVIDTLSLFHQLGFVIHPDKSVLIPS